MAELISESHHNITYDDNHYLGEKYLDKITDHISIDVDDPLFYELSNITLEYDVKKRWNTLHYLIRQQPTLCSKNNIPFNLIHTFSQRHKKT